MLTFLTLSAVAAAPSFQVADDAFLLNGSPIAIRSGSIHYHRTHPSTWADRLRRLHAMGLNAVQTYVPWNFHSQARGVYDFSGPRDLIAFVEAVQAEGLLLNLRAGPYICGEHDFGGLPSYLLNTPGISSAGDLRTNNTAYLTAVSEWWGALLPRVAPYLIASGGPIAMVQLENEYGSYGNVKGNAADRAYMMALRALALQLLPAGTQLYTTDGNDAGYLNGGALPGVVFATGDGSGPPWAADAYNPPGWRAHINSELYPGWLTHWGESMANISAGSTVGDVSKIMSTNASFNLYMGFGGTNWGYNGGANGGGSSYQPVITSYDYDAPVSEGGGHGYGRDGDKYDAIRRIISYYNTGPPPPPEPPAPAVSAYGALALTASAPFFGNEALLAPSPRGGLTAPLPSMEALGAPVGYVLYTLALPPVAPKGGTFSLALSGVADFATVFLNGVPQGQVWRPAAAPVALDPAAVAPGATLAVLVENMGHLNYGRGWWDPKGITGASINGAALGANWSAAPVGLDWAAAVSRLPFAPGPPAVPGPAFFTGTFTLAGVPTDTYIALCGWGKGQVWINGFHLGRFWGEKGPQHSYYVPAALLSRGANNVTVFENKAAPSNVSVAFVDKPDFTGAVCGLAAPPPPPAGAEEGARPQPRAAAAPRAAPVSLPRAAPAACPASPASGANLILADCGAGTPPAAALWAWATVRGDAGLLQLAATPSLCAVQRGKNPDTGEPNIALGACNNTDTSQHWLPFPLNNNMMLNPISGLCLDAENGSAGAGARVELYGCNGGGNQGWVPTQVPGGIHVVGVGSGLCLAACGV